MNRGNVTSMNILPRRKGPLNEGETEEQEFAIRKSPKKLMRSKINSRKKHMWLNDPAVMGGVTDDRQRCLSLTLFLPKASEHLELTIRALINV